MSSDNHYAQDKAPLTTVNDRTRMTSVWVESTVSGAPGLFSMAMEYAIAVGRERSEIKMDVARNRILLFAPIRWRTEISCIRSLLSDSVDEMLTSMDRSSMATYDGVLLYMYRYA